MLFERFEDTDLSQYSYAVGCPGAGEVAIVDPRRDIGVYLDYARREGLRIVDVVETHIHADFASGAHELAGVTGAQLRLSAYDAGELFEVAFEHTAMEDGDAWTIGGVRLQALHTPGHTPEHLSYLVFEQARSAEVPSMLLSGDFLFVGSLGRPDLLGDEAKLRLANQLFESVRDKLAGLPDGLEVHPGHGSGSMCGAGMSGRPMSTLGFERIANPYLSPDLSRQQFIDRILGNVPPFPDYYRRMKQLNADGAPFVGERAAPPPVGPERFHELVDNGYVVVDVRGKDAFVHGHIPDAYFVGHRPAMWGAWTVPYETPYLLVANDAEHAARAWSQGLARVGLDDARGFLDGGMDAWVRAGHPVASTEQIDAEALSRWMNEGGVDVLDVRGAAGFEAGHIAGATHLLAGNVQSQLAAIPAGEEPLAVICNTGFQSTVVSSVLERAGRTGVVNVTGGMSAWRAAGLPESR